ncbi:hypothetical protein C8Q78DRAFT_1153506 [Trametes maxima]|nr:hypothetical protein C8Q78DRAFT_1153506 [Trametes maxima]
MHIDSKHTPSPQDEADDASEWEDVPETDSARQGSVGAKMRQRRSSSVVPSTSRTSRATTKRRKPVRTTLAPQPGQPQPAQSYYQALPESAVPLAKVKKQNLPALDREDVKDALIYGTAETARYIGAVVTVALRLLRWPLGLALALWLLGLLLIKLSSTLRVVFAPVCFVPGISGSAFCRPPKVEFTASGEPVPQWANYPELVEIQSSSFEALLDGSVGGSTLSLEIKQAEMASKDLVTLVRYSDLRSRDLLAESLLEFVEDAKDTGKGLQKLTSKINGAVDKIMAINDYALHTIEAARNEPKSILQVIWPFAPVEEVPKGVVIQAFRDSMDVHATEMKRLVLELSVSEANLERLDMHLSTLHDLCTRENITLNAERDELLAQLWTILGGNGKRVRGMDRHLELLRDLSAYRRRAAAHVAVAKQTLLVMSQDIEDLRERVAAPDIVGDRIPAEVHMKSIRSGLERLKDDRIKAREREELLMGKVLDMLDA